MVLLSTSGIVLVMTTYLETPTLNIGDTLPNGAIVVAWKHIHDAGDGVHATWKALCIRQDNPFHPYAVWTVVARPEGWLAGHGHYFVTLTEGMNYLLPNNEEGDI